MCHYCGTKFEKSNNYTKQENEQSTGLNCGSPVQSCKFCGEKNTKETVNPENPSSRAMPSISPTASLRSSDSSLSSCSDILADPNLSDRDYAEDIRIDGNQEAFSSLLQRHDEASNLPVKSNGFHETVDVSNSDGNHEEGLDNNVESVNSSGDGEVDDEFWFPPEPEDQEDDIIGSIANYEDDDDECGEGWAKPSSFSSFGEEGSGSYKFKEEKLKAMNDVKMGKFRALVSQLVKSVGVDFSGDEGENWVDIVTSLSWEAAAFVKPDADDGKAMDPDGYVKVKCIATGSRTESQLIKGLVFKKRAAHKHMPTKYKNPRLLLIHGSLDLSSSGLSSFDVMQQRQEDDNLKPIVEMLDMYHPNVILVEKSVSRLIQEAILAKGITLVFDMKLHRLERVARVIGSPIMASEVVIGQKLRQCDSFHIDKFVEEHAVSAEGGKKSTKTLMFLEGAPSRLGCTILLMGANSEELKRVKCVVRCAVVMAYHLMLETSFLLDQTAMFSTTFPGEIVDLALSCGQFVVTNDATSNGLHKIESQELSISSEDSSSLSFEGCNPGTFPGLSITTSIQKVMNDSFPHGFDGRKQDSVAENDIQISSENDIQAENESKNRYEEDNLLNNEEGHSDGVEEQVQGKDEINSVFDSESILVLMSSRNAARGTICEHSHFSQIKFYRSFDVPLGKFLQDNLLKQNLECKVCKEPPEAHFFYYAHHNKQLTIQVRHLHQSLPGETEGKLWMWSRCGRCKLHDGSSKSTKRVLISTAARGLSFGKFLELSFSNHSSFNSLSSCGHSFHKDFLYFFGLGPMVAMFKHSPVVTYSVSLPAQKIEFNASIKGEFLKKDSENVYSKGIVMFTEIEKSLKDLENRYAGLTLNIQGSSKEFSDIVEMLQQEKSQFEAEIENASKNGSEDDAVCKLLRLNKVRLELLLESCIWDRRLHCLHSSDLKVVNSDSVDFHAQENSPKEDPGDIEIEKHDDSPENTFVSEIKLDTSLDRNDLPDREIQIDDQDGEPALDSLNENGSILHEDHAEGDSQDENLGSSIKLQTDRMVSIDSSIGEVKHSLENDKDWIWSPFADIEREYMEDLQMGYLPKFESCSSYAAESMAQKVILDEGSRLHIPLGLNDYIISDYEDEYSSIIACALTLLKDAPLGNEDLTEDFQREKGIDSLPRLYSLASPRWSSFNSLDLDSLQSPPAHSLEDVHSSSFDGLDLLESLVSYGAKHPEVSMGLGKHPGTRKYSVLCVYSSEFRQLRDRCCPSEVDYIASLSRCRNWDAKGGKSKSFFAKTLDDRFIIKEIKRTEFDSFMKFATNYFDYMNECYELGNQTCLAKILGIYQVVIRGTKNGKEARHDLLVMENLSFGRKIARQYDLKGALHARLNTAGNSAGDVLLDQNFVNDMNLSPLYVGRKSKRNLQRAVYNDTHFLNSINVMDYSLLVGVDTQRRELVCGIIDYLRQYTWDKQLENWVKSSLVPKNQLPTVISPVEYKKRFRKFINTHFLSVPDHWCSQRSSNPCKLCGPVEGNGSLQPKPVKRANHDDEAGSLKSLQDGE